MREAFGGTMIMYILIPVLFLFIVFIAFIMNYASAYRASNYVISQIETCDANLSSDTGCKHGSKTSIEDYIREKYHYNNGISYCYIQNKKGTIYRALLKVAFDLPLIGRVGVYKVVSESKTIYDVYEADKAVFGDIGPCNPDNPEGTE